MTNVEIWEWMQRDLDGDLAPEEQAALLALLEKDADLQLKYNRLKNVSLQLEQLPPVVPSFSIVDSILPKLESAAATPAAKADLNEVVLPTLEVKRTSSQPSESKKWKNKTVWFARIGSTAVAACLLIGVLLVGNEARKNGDDPSTHGSVITPTAVEPPAFIGPPAPQPSTNPTPITEVGDEKPATEKTQPPKQKKAETPSKTATKTPATPPSQVQNPPAQSVPVVVPMKPVPREPKPPAFPFGLEEKSDDDDNKSEKDKDKEMRKESKVENKESKKEGKGKTDEKKDKDDEDDDDHDDDDDEKKESKRQYGRTIAV